MIFDERGNYIPWGPVERVRTETFLGISALPAWLAVDSNGTVSFADTVTTTAYAMLTTTAVSGAVNGITHKGTPSSSFDMTQMEVRWKVDGLYFSGDENTFEFQLANNSGNTRGTRAAWRVGGGGVFEAAAGAQTSKAFEYDVLSRGEFARRRCIEFITRPDRIVLLRENGAVVAWHQFTPAQLTLGAGIPRLLVVNKTAAAQWLRFAQITVTVCHF